MEFDKDKLRLWAQPSEELGALEVFISFHFICFDDYHIIPHKFGTNKDRQMNKVLNNQNWICNTVQSRI